MGLLEFLDGVSKGYATFLSFILKKSKSDVTRPSLYSSELILQVTGVVLSTSKPFQHEFLEAAKKACG